MQPGEKQLGEMQLGEMQHFNTTPLGEMQPGEMQFGEMQLSPSFAILHFTMWRVFNILKMYGFILKFYKPYCEINAGSYY
ncbi:hypothetical protein H8356DRAFT_1333730 [Neocallimastix lanati (nom. inval.)]|nr:hypothetical protein H8356DRAFT_1333730 [Neocallimastix sp. JGI-2020a]